MINSISTVLEHLEEKNHATVKINQTGKADDEEDGAGCGGEGGSDQGGVTLERGDWTAESQKKTILTSWAKKC